MPEKPVDVRVPTVALIPNNHPLNVGDPGLRMVEFSRLLKPVFGLAADAPNLYFNTDCGMPGVLAHVAAHETVNYHSDHPTSPKQPRFDWKEQADGIKLGYLKAEV